MFDRAFTLSVAISFFITVMSGFASWFALLEKARRRRYPIVIAEIGAKYAPIPVLVRSIEAAKASGVDMVKFQTFTAESIAAPNARMRTPDGREVLQQDFFRQYELSPADHEALIACCRKVGVAWFSTPSSPADIQLLERFDPVCYKTGSDDLTNLPLLRHLARTGRPLIVSTGMSTIQEVERAVETVRAEGNDAIALLHCVVSYPSRPEDANLNVIPRLREHFRLPIGLSDHTTDEYTSVLAAALGAELIEKHFTPDHALKLQDDEASLDPDQMSFLVRRVALVPDTLGDGVKGVRQSERAWRSAARKSLFAARDIEAGAAIGMDDLVVLRPFTGIGADEIDSVLGRAAKRRIGKGEALAWDMF